MSLQDFFVVVQTCRTSVCLYTYTVPYSISFIVPIGKQLFILVFLFLSDGLIKKLEELEQNSNIYKGKSGVS